MRNFCCFATNEKLEIINAETESINQEDYDGKAVDFFNLRHDFFRYLKHKELKNAAI